MEKTHKVIATKRQNVEHWWISILDKTIGKSRTINGGRFLDEKGIKSVEQFIMKALREEQEKTLKIEEENERFAKTINYMKEKFKHTK